MKKEYQYYVIKKGKKYLSSLSVDEEWINNPLKSFLNKTLKDTKWLLAQLDNPEKAKIVKLSIKIKELK